MSTCKFCALVADGKLQESLPNLLVQTACAVVAVNRRPFSPGHLTVMLKCHRDRTSELCNNDLAGFGSLIGRLATLLEKRYRPGRVIFLGDGKRSAHLHLHLIPEPVGQTLDLGAAVTDLNLASRPPTVSEADIGVLVRELREAWDSAP